jgi:hypothetical protein
MMRFHVYVEWRGQHVSPAWAAKPRKWHAQCRHPIKKSVWCDRYGRPYDVINFKETP